MGPLYTPNICTLDDTTTEPRALRFLLSHFNYFFSRLPGRGGVLTPGFAFANTTLIERLNAHDVTFKVKVEDS